MTRMIRADLSRIVGRIPRHIILLVMALIEAMVLFAFTGKDTDGTYFNFILSQFLIIIPFMLGMIEMGFIYGDDLRAKVMHVCVGLGISRRKIVLAKWIEAAFLIAIDFVFMILIAYGMSLVRHFGIETFLWDAVKIAIKEWTLTVSFMTISTFFIYMTQSTGIATMVFILLSFGIVDAAVSIIANIKQIQFLQLQTCTISYFVANSPVHPLHILGIILYVLVALILTIFVFGSKELDF